MLDCTANALSPYPLCIVLSCHLISWRHMQRLVINACPERARWAAYAAVGPRWRWRQRRERTGNYRQIAGNLRSTGMHLCGQVHDGGINKLYSTQTPVEVLVMFCYNIIQRKNKSERIKPCTGLASLESNSLPQLLLPCSSVPMKPWLPSEDSSLNQLFPIVCPVFPASRVTFTCTRNLGRRASSIFI